LIARIPTTRLAFLGTPEPAAVVLRALTAAGHDVALVVTRVDKRRGRNEAPRPSPVKVAALELGWPVSHRVEDVVDLGADLGVVVAFGRIISGEVLARLDMVNVHFSLLPRWRGAAPVERAVLAGDRVTGVCLMAIDEGLDTGPVFCCEETTIGETETASALTGRLARIGARLVVSALEEGLGLPVPQSGEATYASKITPEDLHLDWTESSAELVRVVRVGRAWTTWRGKRLLVHQAFAAAAAGRPALPPGTLDGAMVWTGDGQLQLEVVQPEGKGSAAAPDWVRGARPAPGERLGQ
jgi:methionyl-tRNA formyltransferase